MKGKDRNQLCACGSGKKTKYCHHGTNSRTPLRLHPLPDNPTLTDSRAHLAELFRLPESRIVLMSDLKHLAKLRASDQSDDQLEADKVSRQLQQAFGLGYPVEAEDPPPYLYHYTSLDGLQGILATGTIWCTEIAHLNDPLERTHINQQRETLLARLSAALSGDGHKFYEAFRNYVCQPVVDELRFVTCFCESGDLLSMWRGYASNGGGFSLGFDGQKIANIGRSEAESGEYMLARVVYGDDIFSHPSAENVTKLLTGAAQASYPVSAPLLGALAAPAFTNLVVRSKNEAFREEQEWRITVRHQIDDFVMTLIRFRRGVNDIKPYIVLSCKPGEAPDTDAKLPLREVIVGPTLRPEPTIRALRLLLRKYGYSDKITIKVSKVPYQP